ncbi:uncharacterized protein MYCFIDRAFT_195080 [Pseudocercospora fijiensis CIRAD86]|uniref:Uncharacterized protein n=1 Tax=Pseudocercospora fijiensis (strain CIRAD86) TaxID=383855 RepID=M3B3C1_PSEFD|nr:uncharacterized protein MYCFIDRAFT_195080 [Pseudocercospora fijiensis CIRAD86]EME83872.1 hypothetical protein MYCFIDRAFT_195080 [Pseudocercospora fijiensis CIRAD86]
MTKVGRIVQADRVIVSTMSFVAYEAELAQSWFVPHARALIGDDIPGSDTSVDWASQTLFSCAHCSMGWRGKNAAPDLTCQQEMQYLVVAIQLKVPYYAFWKLVSRQLLRPIRRSVCPHERLYGFLERVVRHQKICSLLRPADRHYLWQMPSIVLPNVILNGSWAEAGPL